MPILVTMETPGLDHFIRFCLEVNRTTGDEHLDA